MKTTQTSILTVFVIGALFNSLLPTPAFAATAPNLGVAAGYSVFGNAGITETAAQTSNLWGNASGNGFGHVSLIASQVAGTIDAVANIPVVGAISTAYGDLAGEAQTGVADLATSPIVGPGVYDVAATSFNSTLTLDGAGIYIFRSSSSIAQTAGGTMILSNGATACDVYWQIPAAMTFAATGNIEGTIIAGTLISFVSGTSLKGRAWAGTQVTMDNNQITEPTCAPLPPPPSPPASQSSRSGDSNRPVAVATTTAYTYTYPDIAQNPTSQGEVLGVAFTPGMPTTGMPPLGYALLDMFALMCSILLIGVLARSASRSSGSSF